MKLSALVAAALCFLVVNASAGSSKRKRDTVSAKSISVGPSNEAVVLGQTPNGVRLTCRVPPGSTARVQWIEFGTTPSGNLISDGNILLPGHPNSLRYVLDVGESGSGQYDLIINPVVLADGTYYVCRDFDSVPPEQRQLGAQLVVIEDTPNCTTTMTNPVVLEGDYHTYECIMNFRASAGVEPLITWSGPEPFVTASAVTNASVWSGLSSTIQRHMDAMTYSAKVNFTSTGFISPDSASNIPSYTYTYRSPQILVNWAPKNMYITPDQETYNVGTVLTCFADAFPQATIYWQNLDTNEVSSSPSIVLTAAMVGENRMRCHAENFINGAQYFNDLFTVITVNPIPTTQTPGLTTTTTSPPAEAYCSDLTGQWKSENPKGTLCLWVDLPSNGVVTGLLRNDTATYWLDVYGRVQVNTFDQGGFATISPGTIGVGSYVLECKACVGVEKMTVSRILRSDTSATECGGIGDTLQLPDYTFYRVASTAPCNASPPLP